MIYVSWHNGRMYPWGNEAPDCSRLNYLRHTGIDYVFCMGDTSQMGNYPPGASPHGALDMSGNGYGCAVSAAQ